MNIKEFQQLLDGRFTGSLGAAKFRRLSLGTWVRCIGEVVSVVQGQSHSSKDILCVNLGVHYSFLPKAGSSKPIKLGTMSIIDCEIKLRLTSSMDDHDQWWPPDAERVDEIDRLICDRALVQFDEYRLPGTISELRPDDIANGEMGLLYSLTRVRALLLMARVHEHLGNPERCRESAEMGLKFAGMAVGPKKELRMIIERSARET